MRDLRREDCAVLYLTLKRKWYDMIASGKKREEYRDHSQYWSVRLQNLIMHSGRNKPIVAAFSLGRTRATMFFEVSLIKAVSGSQHPEWGEPKDLHYLILLGGRVNLVAEEAK